MSLIKNHLLYHPNMIHTGKTGTKIENGDNNQEKPEPDTTQDEQPQETPLPTPQNVPTASIDDDFLLTYRGITINQLTEPLMTTTAEACPTPTPTPNPTAASATTVPTATSVPEPTESTATAVAISVSDTPTAVINNIQKEIYNDPEILKQIQESCPDRNITDLEEFSETINNVLAKCREKSICDKNKIITLISDSINNGIPELLEKKKEAIETALNKAAELLEDYCRFNKTVDFKSLDDELTAKKCTAEEKEVCKIFLATYLANLADGKYSFEQVVRELNTNGILINDTPDAYLVSYNSSQNKSKQNSNKIFIPASVGYGPMAVFPVGDVTEFLTSCSSISSNSIYAGGLLLCDYIPVVGQITSAFDAVITISAAFYDYKFNKETYGEAFPFKMGEAIPKDDSSEAKKYANEKAAKQRLIMDVVLSIAGILPGVTPQGLKLGIQELFNKADKAQEFMRAVSVEQMFAMLKGNTLGKFAEAAFEEGWQYALDELATKLPDLVTVIYNVVMACNKNDDTISYEETEPMEPDENVNQNQTPGLNPPYTSKGGNSGSGSSPISKPGSNIIQDNNNNVESNNDRITVPPIESTPNIQNPIENGFDWDTGIDNITYPNNSNNSSNNNDKNRQDFQKKINEYIDNVLSEKTINPYISDPGAWLNTHIDSFTYKNNNDKNNYYENQGPILDPVNNLDSLTRDAQAWAIEKYGEQYGNNLEIKVNTVIDSEGNVRVSIITTPINSNPPSSTPIPPSTTPITTPIAGNGGSVESTKPPYDYIDDEGNYIKDGKVLTPEEIERYGLPSVTQNATPKIVLDDYKDPVTSTINTDGMIEDAIDKGIDVYSFNEQEDINKVFNDLKGALESGDWNSFYDKLDDEYNKNKRQPKPC